MSLPPERISIKRRRQEEPVETLILEDKAAHSKKRRFTDFFFQRLRNETIAPVSTTSLQAGPTGSSRYNEASQSRLDEIPSVRTSAPGDEITDFQKFKAKQKHQQERADSKSSKANTDQVASPPVKPSSSIASTITGHARRFHLTHNISSVLKPDPSSGIRRRKLNLRPPLATFVERHSVKYVHDAQTIHQNPPIDHIVRLSKDIDSTSGQDPVSDSIASRTSISTFLKPAPTAVRSGHSIRDDPNTWDHGSDQLADELASLALELDPDALESDDNTQVFEQSTTPAAAETMLIDSGDEYVFETYIRVRHSSGPELPVPSPGVEFGILVIDDEDEDLWDKYVESDNDDEWNIEDEDSNAEDNPRNDYPEDEVSTDDEYGNNVYRHRHNGSDDEEYDDQHDNW